MLHNYKVIMPKKKQHGIDNATIGFWMYFTENSFCKK